jgi:hypothetical protein
MDGATEVTTMMDERVGGTPSPENELLQTVARNVKIYILLRGPGCRALERLRDTVTA